MVIDDLNLVRIAFSPHKTEAELIVDSDAVLSLTVAMQGFKAVCRRNAKLFHCVHVIERHEFPHRHTPYASRNSMTLTSLVQQFRVGVLETGYHEWMVTRFDSIVKR